MTASTPDSLPQPVGAPAAAAAPEVAASAAAMVSAAGAADVANAQGTGGTDAAGPGEVAVEGAGAESGSANGEPGPRPERRARGERPERGDRADRGPRPDKRGAAPGRSAPPADAVIDFSDVVSGRFDEEESSEAVVLTKRVLLPQVETPKLHKVLAQAGLGSRIEMEQLILEGRISVNNEPAHIGQRVQFGDQVKVNGKPIRYRIEPPPARVIAYHKPVGEVVTNDDPQNRPTVFRKLPRLQQGKWQSVGRLDLNTEGLLLFTSSGELANRLMHPRFGLEREYAVRVLGALSNDEKQRLLDGVKLDDGVGQFGSIEDGGGEGSNCWYRVTISEGRHREVRRLIEAVGHAVSRLIRIRYGAMVLPRGLKRGAWVELDEREIRLLTAAAGGPSADAPAPNRHPAMRGQANGGGRKGGGRAGRPGPGPRDGGPRDAGEARGSRARPPLGQGPNDHLSSLPSFGPANGQRPGRPPRRQPNPGQGGGGQPDPMRTSLGYIGADSFSRQRSGGPGAGGNGGPRRGGSGAGGGGGGGGFRRGGRGR